MLRAKQPIATRTALRKTAVGSRVRKIRISLSGPIESSSSLVPMAGNAFATTANVNQSPVMPVTAPVTAAAITAAHFPSRSSAREAEVASRVSSVLRSFSPVVASIAVCIEPAAIMTMRRYGMRSAAM